MFAKSGFLKRHRLLLSVAIYLVCIAAVAYATMSRERGSMGRSSEEMAPSRPSAAIAPGSDAPEANPMAVGNEASNPGRQGSGRPESAHLHGAASAEELEQALLQRAQREGESEVIRRKDAEQTAECARAEFPAREEPPSRQDRIPRAPMGTLRTASALEHAPGYVPPDDPEAESEVTGRREAPLADREFAGGARSAENLARDILAALRANDRERLQTLRVLPGEFEEILWPEFPQSRPITNLQAADAYFFIDRNCIAGLSQGLSDFGGKDLRVERIGYEIGSRDYRNFTLYDGVVIHAQTPSGEAEEIKFAPVFAERHGIWKVYSYKD